MFRALIWPPMVPFWLAGEFTTDLRTYFSGDWDVHWGYGILTHGHLSPPLFCTKAKKEPLAVTWTSRYFRSYLQAHCKPKPFRGTWSPTRSALDDQLGIFLFFWVVIAVDVPHHRSETLVL